MGRKGTGTRRKASSAAGPPGSQAADSKVNRDDATSGSDATGSLLIQKVAFVQKKRQLFLFPAAAYEHAT